MFVDAAAPANGNGTAQRPHKTIAAAVAAARDGAVICVAEGTYAEQIKPGEKASRLPAASSAARTSRCATPPPTSPRRRERGGSFIRIEDPGPKGKQRTVIDGFDISGYSQAIFRDFYESQRFDITNNHIHDNKCDKDELMGAGFCAQQRHRADRRQRVQEQLLRHGRCGVRAGHQAGEHRRDRAQSRRQQPRNGAGFGPTAAPSSSAARRSGSRATCSRATR